MRLIEEQVENFTYYLTERQTVYERRAADDPPPWTLDPILQRCKFCCVVRDDDRTSREARSLILAEPNEQTRQTAVVVFRLVNHINTLRALLPLLHSPEAVQAWLMEHDRGVFGTAFRIAIAGKLWDREGVARLMRWAIVTRPTPQRAAANTLDRLRNVGYGAFMAYQVLQDMRWLGHRYIDEDRWCFAGAGAIRGMDRLSNGYIPRLGSDRGTSTVNRRLEGGSGVAGSEKWLHAHRAEMAALLAAAREAVPSVDWNLFEIEHNLCEYDKYDRVRTGETPGASFRPRL